MAEASQNVKALITAAIIVIVVAALIGALATETQNRTSKTLATETGNLVYKSYDSTSLNDTRVYTVSQVPNSNIWKREAADCVISGFVLKNASGTALVATTDYVIVSTTAGTYTLVNNTNTVQHFAVGTNLSNRYYYYCADDYMNVGWGRTLLGMVPAFIALALLVAVIGITYILLNKSYGKD